MVAAHLKRYWWVALFLYVLFRNALSLHGKDQVLDHLVGREAPPEMRILTTLFMGLYGNIRVNTLHVTKKIGLDIIE